MSRNRMIKPEFWTSETLMRVSLQSRLTFIGVWNFCDDYGFTLHSIRKIIGDVYPNDESVSESDVKQWIDELIKVKLVIPLTYNGKNLLFIKGWGEHQTVQHKSKRAYIQESDLEEVITSSLKSHEDLVSVYLASHAPKRKKKEESNKEESNKEESNKEEEFNTSEIFNNYKNCKFKNGNAGGLTEFKKKFNSLTNVNKNLFIDSLPFYKEFLELHEYQSIKGAVAYINNSHWEKYTKEILLDVKNTISTQPTLFASPAQRKSQEDLSMILEYTSKGDI